MDLLGWLFRGQFLRSFGRIRLHFGGGNDGNGLAFTGNTTTGTFSRIGNRCFLNIRTEVGALGAATGKFRWTLPSGVLPNSTYYSARDIYGIVRIYTSMMGNSTGPDSASLISEDSLNFGNTYFVSAWAMTAYDSMVVSENDEINIKMDFIVENWKE